MKGKDYCRHHGPGSKDIEAAPRIEVAQTETDVLIQKILDIQAEQEHLLGLLLKKKQSLERDKEDLSEETKAAIRERQSKLTPEDVERLREKTRQEFGRRVQRIQGEIVDKHRAVAEGPKVTITPDRDDSFAYPSKDWRWNFKAGVKTTIPEAVAEVAKNRWQAQDEYLKFKRTFGSKKPTEAGTFVGPDGRRHALQVRPGDLTRPIQSLAEGR